MTRVPRRTCFVVQPNGDVWFFVPMRGDWIAAYRVVARGGRTQVAELRVSAGRLDSRGRPVFGSDGFPVLAEPLGGLTSGYLKDQLVLGKHIGDLLPESLDAASGGVGASRVRDQEGHETTLSAMFLGPVAESVPQGARRGPKPRPDLYYAELAAEYLRCCQLAEVGVSGRRSPIATLATARGMTKSAVRAALHKSVKKGLLKMQRGRAGGSLSQRGKDVLEAAQAATKRTTTRRD